jgi:PEP-CTERM motif
MTTRVSRCPNGAFRTKGPGRWAAHTAAPDRTVPEIELTPISDRAALSQRKVVHQMWRAILLSVAVCAMVVGQASAGALVGVSFNTNSTGPTNWNVVTPTTNSPLINLIDESGSSTSISIAFDTNTAFFSGTLDALTVPIHTPSLASLTGNVDSTASGASYSATLSGLVPDSIYDVWVFTARFAQPTGQTVTITGAGSGTSFTQTDSNTDQLLVNSSLGSNTEPLSFYALPIESSGSGQISIAIAGGDSGYGLTGVAVQFVQSVPEPTTFILLGIGIAGMAGYMWRKGKSQNYD